jgi:hypothetical protein
MNLKLNVCVAVTICCAAFSVFAQGIQFFLADNFIDRSPLLGGGTNFFIYGSLSNATSEADEPFIDGVSSGQTVWGTWTAPSSGIATLSVNATTFSPLLEIYTGNDLPSLSLIASNNFLACYEDGQCGCHWRERNQITFHVASGQAYQICVDSAIITDASFDSSFSIVQATNVLSGGDVQLGLQFTPAPTNDDFEQRIKIQGPRLHFLTSNAGATKQLGEPDHLGNPGGSSVWYSWTAPASGRVTLSTNNVPDFSPPSSSGQYGEDDEFIIDFIIPPPTCGNEIDQNPPPVFYPIFAAYTGTAVDSLTSANCLPAALDAFPNMVEFDAVKGQTYQIAFDGNMGTTGDIPLYLALTQPASNNNFANRIQLHGIYAVATSYNAGATHQAGEPVFGDSTGKTVWWSWTAPVSGTVSIDLSGSDYSFPVAVFTGSTLAGLQMVAEDSGGVSFEAVAGQAYQIAVGDFGGLTGAIDLKLQAPIVELPLSKVIKSSSSTAMFFYTASNGQIILFQRSNDGSTWQNMQTGPAVQNTVEFIVHPAPTDNGPYYRAIVVDRKF